jgi:shikimate dehydrogenase
MKFGLVGFPIEHSLSPSIYSKLLGPDLQYDLLNIPYDKELPTLAKLSETYDGINITTPYKRKYVNDVEFEIEGFSPLGFINVISFVDGKFIASNTDYLAVEAILERYVQEYPNLLIILLGSGAMAELTQIIAASLEIPLVPFARSSGHNMDQLDLTQFNKTEKQILVINACSRDYVFNGQIGQDFLFWDYNYSYLPDGNTLPSRVKEYKDGQELLLLQAKSAVEFWKRTNPKLK